MKLFEYNADTIYQIFPQNYNRKFEFQKFYKIVPFPLISSSHERTSLLRNRRFSANQILQNNK